MHSNNPYESVHQPCDHCEGSFSEEYLRGILFESNKGELTYTLCHSCIDSLADRLVDQEMIACLECMQRIAWADEPCKCER